MKKNNIWSKSQVPLANYTFYAFCILLVILFSSLIFPAFDKSSFAMNVGVSAFLGTPILGSLVVWRYSKGDTFTDKLMSVVNKASKIVFFSSFICLILITFSNDFSFEENPFAWSAWIVSLCVAFYFNLNPSPNERRTVVDAVSLTLGQLVISIILIFVILRIIKGFVNSLKN